MNLMVSTIPEIDGSALQINVTWPEYLDRPACIELAGDGADRYIDYPLFRCYAIGGDFDDLDQTVQTLAVLLDRAPDGPALVVAPTSVVANWADEARRFAPTLNVNVYTGTAATRARLLDDPAPFDLYITTYGLLQNDIERLAETPWHSAVLDEAQAIKNLKHEV